MTWFRRARVRLRVVVLLWAVIAVLSIAGATWVLYDEKAPAQRLSLNCLPFQPAKDVAGLNRQIARYRAQPGFVGADVGASATLSDGRSLWVFGDTLRPKRSEGPRFVRNSMLMFSPGCATVVMPSDHGAVVPDRKDGVGYWPMDLVAVPRGDHDLVGVSLQRVRATGKGVFDFEILGPSYALFSVKPGKAPELLLVSDRGPDSTDPTKPLWGAALEEADGWLYVYGTANPDPKTVFGRSLRVARVRPEQVGLPDHWQYWDGTTWQAEESRAAELIGAVGGVSQVLSVFHRGKDWYAVSKRDELLGTDLVIWKAPGPTGPFTPSAPLATLPSNSSDGLLRYMPLAHPDLLPSPDQLVVSYSRNVSDLTRLLENPHLYRPEFLQVPLP
ncbi:DUF4185 domain-containing protein [Marmoricola sp. RAF53]|uniref:DUF4185 domain-containing protein n=1 Tax=Marmoricola sp. RAF53 TaxID=3233059 RepID=UPI003F98800E